MINLTKFWADLSKKILIIMVCLLIISGSRILGSQAQDDVSSEQRLIGDHQLRTVAEIDYFHFSEVEIQGRSRPVEQTVVATNEEDQSVEISSNGSVELATVEPKSLDNRLTDQSEDYQATREVFAIVTAYNPVPEQTDSTPCLTANNTEICSEKKSIVAANWLPFGTKVKIPDYFGDRVFEVQDRMNKRYSDRVDVLMYDLAEARQFGKRNLRIVILD